eukprot:TRINITY_DN62876_c0_g1_i2.p2 TRINITY_DN62876_c0_g1~~TRINITY_DN62876_c0_g1_i2.p2  ORF type:complete len:257 (+),score=99.00 TRINITY_DN62876_c0_g1_i2:190-960(+)
MCIRDRVRLSELVEEQKSQMAELEAQSEWWHEKADLYEGELQGMKEWQQELESSAVGKRRVQSKQQELRYMKREQLLRCIFKLFDLDRSDSIEYQEMKEIAVKRRELGHKRDIWTEDKNRALMARLDANKDGLVTCKEFVRYYAKLHTGCSPVEFLEVVGRYMEVAGSLYGDKMREMRADLEEVSVLMRERSLREQLPAQLDAEIEQNARAVVQAWNAEVESCEEQTSMGEEQARMAQAAQRNTMLILDSMLSMLV